MYIAIRGRYTWLAWIANPNPNTINPNPNADPNPNPNPNPTLLTLHTASRVTIRLGVCIDTFKFYNYVGNVAFVSVVWDAFNAYG